MLKRVSMLLVVASASHALAREPRAERLPEADRVWLEEEVVYIITDREREVFLSLSSAEERHHFVDAFWRRRDPNPVTPVNEFRDEHYRRLEYANESLDDQSILPGWKTERGRMYIMLGAPLSIERFNMDNRLVTSELWFYEGDTARGLPPFFNLIFFKRMDAGEFRLYSPTADGPPALVRGRFAVEPKVAIETISRTSPELARASLSIEARAGGDFLTGIASLENETTMMRIEDSPKYAVRTDYLDGWERYGGRVAAEYSFNYVPSRSTFAVLPLADGTPFLHFAIELDPENFSLESDASKFYTTLDVSVEARTPDGTLVLADDKETYIELTERQLETIRMAPVAYQDSFPIVPGDYQLSVIFRNRVHTRFTVAEAALTVPAYDETNAGVSDIVLGYLAEEPTRGGMRTFQLRDRRVHPSTDGAFTRDEQLYAMFRVFGAGENGRLRLRISSGGATVSEREAHADDIPDGVFDGGFSLSRLLAGDYRLEVDLLSNDGAVIAARRAPFQISPRTAIARASFIARRQFPSSEPGRIALERAAQLMALARFEEAVVELENAVDASSDLPMARWKLAQAYNRLGKPERALELLLPMAGAFASEFDVSMGLGVAYYLLEDFDNAVSHLERAIAIRAPNPSQLNALGNSYAKLGRYDDARRVYQRSLALDPAQESVAAALKALDHDGQKEGS